MWRVYYGNGETFTSDQGGAHDAPRTDVQIIAQQDQSMGWELLSSSDYYYYEEDRRNWYIADVFTIFDHLIRAKYPVILFGRMISDDEFTEITKRVLDDLPTPKTAWRRGMPGWLRGV